MNENEIIRGLEAILFAFLAAAGSVFILLGLLVAIFADEAQAGGMMFLSGSVLGLVAYFLRKSTREARTLERGAIR